MYNQMYHEEIMLGGTYGRKIILDAAEIEPGRFEVLAMDEEGSEVDSITVDAADKLRPAFADLLDRLGHPLQAAFYRAGMKKDMRYTLVMLNDFGFPVALRLTFTSATLTTYAQYPDAVSMIFTPVKKRLSRYMYLYNHSFLIYSGWRELKDSIAYNASQDGSTVTRMSKYACFDERFIDDIKQEWPDFIVAYDHDKVYRPDQKAAKPEFKPGAIVPFEFIPGITVVGSPDDPTKPTVDMDGEEFALLYAAPPETFAAAERLTIALRRAAVAAAAHINREDGGTSNFDSPALDYAEYGLTKPEAKAAIEAAGLSSSEWRPFRNHRGPDGRMIKNPTYLLIHGFERGQGDRRTAMAKAFANSLEADHVPATMYYQVD